MTRRGAVAGAVLALLALAAVRGGGGSGPPLYDGICVPPTYITLGANPPPPSLSKTLSAGQVTSTFEEADNDTSPQAQIIVAAGGVALPPGSSSATVAITPVKPPAVKPPDGAIDGNVYDFEVTAGGQRLQVAPNHLVTIALTATAIGGAQRQVEHFDGTHWSAPAKTVPSGCGSTYTANSTSLGVFALVVPAGSSPSNGSGSGSGSGAGGGGGGATIIVVILVVLAVLGLVIGAVRMSRRGGGRGKRRRR